MATGECALSEDSISRIVGSLLKPLVAEIASLRKEVQSFVALQQKVDLLEQQLAELVAWKHSVEPLLADGAQSQSVRSVEELVSQRLAVERGLQRDQAELDAKRRNVVITGFPEVSATEDPRPFVESVATKVGIARGEIAAVFRDGRVPTQKGQSRVVKVQFVKSASRDKFLSQFGRVVRPRSHDDGGAGAVSVDVGSGGDFRDIDQSRIYCRPDLTFTQRQQRRALIDKLKSMRAERAAAGKNPLDLFPDWSTMSVVNKRDLSVGGAASRDWSNVATRKKSSGGGMKRVG